MSAGAVFKLIANDSSIDDLMMRSAQLTAIISQIETARKAKAMATAKAAGKQYVEEDQHESYIPTIAEIANYYTVPIYSFFKPFVACQMEYVKHQAKGKVGFGSTVSFELQQLGLFITDAIVHIRTSTCSATATAPPGAQAGIRYCAFPGHRVLAQTKLKINSNPIDNYYSEDYNAHYAFKVLPHKRDAWMRNVGQQVAQEAIGYTNPLVDEIGQVFHFVEGAQTVRATQAAQDWWIPTLFWFSDPGYALPNGLFPHGSAEMSFELADVNDIITDVAIGAIVPTATTIVRPTITLFELWVNQVYVVPELHDVFIARYGYSMIRVHRHQKKQTTLSEDSIQLEAVRWPVEKIYLALQPTANLTDDQNWYKVSDLTQVDINVAFANPVIGPAPAAAVNTAPMYREAHNVSSLELTVQGGIVLYPKTDPAFYNSAVSFQYGNNDDNGPIELGWYCMNFNTKRSGGIHQGGWQPPSGHVNCSKARELYLNYVSSTISSATPANLIVSATSINFLGVDDSSATLRYST